MSKTFRKEYRELSPDEKGTIENIKWYAEELEKLIKIIGEREGAIAMTHLETAVMWAVKGASR